MWGRLIRQYVAAMATYLTLVLGGVVMTLTLSSAVGYLPYSDRPGPGWQQPSISPEQVGYYLSWATLLVLPSVLWATGVFLWLRLLQLLGTPGLAIRVLGATVAGGLSLFLIAAGGWYIALAAFPVWVGGFLGALWAGVLVPRYLGSPLKAPVPRRQRIAVLGAAIAIPAVAAWAFLVPRYSQDLSLAIVRVTLTGSGPLVSESWKATLEPNEVALLTSLFPAGTLHGGVGGSSGSGGSGNRARMLIVVTGPVSREARLRVPKGVSVVYVQRGDGWQMYPPEATTLRDSIRLLPTTHSGEALFAWPDAEPQTFRWYPEAE